MLNESKTAELAGESSHFIPQLYIHVYISNKNCREQNACDGDRKVQ